MKTIVLPGLFWFWELGQCRIILSAAAAGAVLKP